MKTWDAFHPLVMPDVIGCPIPMVDLELRNAAREFCQYTKAWAEWADAFTATGSTNRFEFDLPNGAELVAAKRANVNGKDLNVFASDRLPGDWQQGNDTGPDGSLVHIDTAEYVIYPRPLAGTAVAIEMALQPSMTASGVGDVILAKHAEAIAWGAKYRLLSKPNKAWTDPKSAAHARAEFERAVHHAANEGFRMTAPNQHRVTLR